MNKNKFKNINLPKDILWDYKKPPEDYMWKLQRIADFFPLYGRDKDTVLALYENINNLRIGKTTITLIKEYYKIYKSMTRKNEKRKNN